MRQGVKRYGAACLASLLVMGSLVGCVILDGTLRMRELTTGDVKVMCDQYDHGLVTCEGGWQAGFESSQSCVEVFDAFREDNAYECSGMTVDEIRACLDVSPCDRPRAEACEMVYRCANDHAAEEVGVDIDDGLY